MATVKENLIAAKALIANPIKWTKHFYGNANTCMCAAGAIRTVTGRRFSETENYLDNLVRREFHGDRGFCTIEEFNDNRGTTHADIMALFARGIAAQDGAS